MKRAFSVLMLCAIFSGCNFSKKPEFIGVANIGVAKAGIDTINLKADAIFKNENDLGGTLFTDEIEVFIDDTYIESVSSEAFKVPQRDDFTVPLLVKFPAAKLFQENDSGLLGAVLKQVLNNQVVVNFKGGLTYVLAGFSFDYPIDHSQEIILK